MNILSNKHQIKNYFIHSFIKRGKTTLLYEADDFATGKRVLLYQFENKQKEVFIILEKISHSNINRVFKVFEFEGSFFAVSRLIEGETLKKYILATDRLLEKDINQYARELLSIMTVLKKSGLGIKEIDLNAVILYKNGEICLSELDSVCRESSDFDFIEVFGQFLYFLVTKEVYQKGKNIVDGGKYSKSLIVFINKILENRETKAFVSLEKLVSLMNVNSNKEESCEPLVCQENRKKSSSVLTVAASLLIFSFLVYIVVFSKERIDMKNLNAIDATRYYVAAHLNNAKAKYALAEMYEYGSYVERDIPKAIKWYKASAKEGYLPAKSYLAYLYFNDKKSVLKDIQKAVYWYKEAAKDGDIDALYSLGYIYANDREVKSIDQAIYWYKEAVKKHYEKAYYPLGVLYFNRKKNLKDYEKALNCFLKEKDSSSYAQITLAYMYAKGLGTKKNTNKAIEYYEKSAKQGNQMAQLNLANIYAYTQDEKLRDKTLAKYWYEKAAQQGNSSAKRELKKLDTLFMLYQRKKAKKVFKQIWYGHLIDKGEYVEDTTTGLLWQKDGRASGRINFYQAQKYARNLRLGGMKGWRVPTAEELDTIFPATEKPFINTMYTDKPCCEKEHYASNYWTSELDTRQDDYAYIYQWYADGGVNNGYASKNYVYVRCVHD